MIFFTHYTVSINLMLINFHFLIDLDEPERLQSLLGVVIILLIGFVFSAYPGHVKWRTVLAGILIEFIMGLLVLRWDVSTVILAI